MDRYKIVCTLCRAERVVAIEKTPVGQRIDWLETDENANHPICSARLRFDGRWGFQCRCGNNDLWTEQETRLVSNQVAPTPQEIKTIVNNLATPEQSNFKLVTI
jgi:hypothetical protein